VGVAVQALGGDDPQREGAHQNQQYAPHNLTGPLDQFRDLPAQKQHAASPDQQDHGVAQREAHGHTNRLAAPGAGRAVRADRERGDGHEVVGTQTVEEAE
jgi:hypothetical protein